MSRQTENNTKSKV